MRYVKLAALLAVVSTMAFSQPVVGALAPSVNFGFGVHGNFMSANLPGPDINGTSALKDVYGAGYGGGVHLDASFAMLSLRLSGDYIKFSPDNDKYREGLTALIGTAAGQFSVDGGGITMWSANLNAKMDILPLPIVKPYMTGGVGFARLSADDATVKQGGVATKQFAGFASTTSTMLNLGAGVDLNVGITLFLEVKYEWVMTDPNTSKLIPVTLGITF